MGKVTPFAAFRIALFLALWAGWTTFLTSEDRGPVLAAIIAVGPVIAFDRFVERQRDWRDPDFAPEPDSLRFVFGFPAAFAAIFAALGLAAAGTDGALGLLPIVAGVAAFLILVGLLGRRRALRRRRALGLPESGPASEADRNWAQPGSAARVDGSSADPGA